MGRDAHHARAGAVNQLGKSLTRRAGSRCELCGGAEALRVTEIEPVNDQPSMDRALLLCRRCRELTDTGELPEDTDGLRFLEEQAWGELLPAKLTAIRLLQRLAEADVPWAREARRKLWIDDELQALL